MAVSPLAVTLPDAAEGAPEASGELWSPIRRQAEPDLPMVEFHPENPNAAPVVSGVIQGFVAPKNPEARASSALAVEFGVPGEPSIQIEATYEQDSKNLLGTDPHTDPSREGGAPAPEDPVVEIPVQATVASKSVTPELGARPFDGDTDRVSVEPSFEEPPAESELPEAELPEAELPEAELPEAELLPTAEVDDISEGGALPVYAVDHADAPLVEVPEPDEEGPAPTKRATVMDSLQPETHDRAGGSAVVHPSPFPPAQDPRVKDAEAPISDAGAYTAPDHEPQAPVAFRPFQPAAFVRTTEVEDARPEPDSEIIQPKLAGVPPLILPPKDTAEPPAPAAPEPVGNAPATMSGVIGGAIVVSSELQKQQNAGEPLTASGSIIIDPELLAAEQAAAEQAAAEQAAAEKAAAEQAAAEKAAAEQAAAEKAAAEKAGIEQAAAEQAAEQAAAEKAAAEQAVAEQAAAENAAAENAAAEKLAAEREAVEQAAISAAAAEKLAAETASKPDPGDGKGAALGRAMAATVRYELSEQPEPARARKKPEPPTSRPVASAARKTPAPLRKADAFSDMEIAFFEQDLQKVDEMDTFDDLVADLPEPDTPWGRLFGKPKGKPRSKSIKRPEPNNRTATDDKPKKTPRPPHKRK